MIDRKPNASASTTTTKSLPFNKLIEVDEKALADELAEHVDEFIPWPVPGYISPGVGRRLRTHICAGMILADLNGRVTVRVSKGRVTLRLNGPQKPMTPRFDPSAELPLEVKEALMTARRKEIPALVVALRDAGWGPRQIAEARGVTHQAVTEVYRRHKDRVHAQNEYPAVPPPPTITPRPPRADVTQRSHARLDTVRALVGSAVLDDLITRHRALPYLVGQSSHRERAICSKFWSDLNDSVVRSRVSVFSLSEAMGMSTHTVAMALSRYGYRAQPPSQAGVLTGAKPHRRSLDSARWVERMAELHAFVQAEGHAQVPNRYVTASGSKLGAWASNARQQYHAGTLPAERAKQLEALPGWAWNAYDSAWERAISELRAFVQEEGHARVPTRYVAASGYRLGAWVILRRVKYRAGEIPVERIAELESFPGWTWDARMSHGRAA